MKVYAGRWVVIIDNIANHFTTLTDAQKWINAFLGLEFNHDPMYNAGIHKVSTTNRSLIQKMVDGAEESFDNAPIVSIVLRLDSITATAPHVISYKLCDRQGNHFLYERDSHLTHLTPMKKIPTVIGRFGELTGRLLRVGTDKQGRKIFRIIDVKSKYKNKSL